MRLIKIYVFCVFACLTFAADAPWAKPTGKILVYGIIAPPKGEEILDTPETSSGKSRTTQSPKLLFLSVTNRIPALMEMRFGVAFSVTNIPATNGQVKLTKIVKHPKMFKPDGTTSEGFTFEEPIFIQDGGGVNYSGYGFDHPYEVVPGVWDFMMKYQDTTLWTQRFVVYKSDPAGK
jgi:hypothetical protein